MGLRTVFLSYASADRKAARAIVGVLEAAGYSVWWDALLEGGERFAQSISAALDQARAVVVLWSPTSSVSHWVHDEAELGRDSGRLVPLSLDGSLPPLGFRQFQAIDVTGALARPDSEPMQKFLRAVAALHDRPMVPIHRPAPRKSGLLARRNVLIAGGVAVLTLGGAAMVARRSELWGGANARSIAVLPFENLSGDPQQQYFSDGLTSEIRTRLTRNPLLQIVGQASSESAKALGADVRAIAKGLSVAFLLTGNVQLAGGRVKIAAELTQGDSGVSKWAEIYERPLADIFAVQSEIGSAVTSSLSAALGERPAGGASDDAVGGTQDVAAFDAFLRGRELYEAGIDEDSDRAALAAFDRAIARDPDYAGAHAARSRALAVIGNLYGDAAERARAFDDAVAAARRATELAPAFAEGFSALGFAFATGKLDMRAARAPYARSYELGAGDADILSRYATFLSKLRENDEAKAIIARSAKLDPLNARTFRSRADVLYAAGEYRQAIDDYRSAIALNPTLSGVHSLLGFAQLLLGQDDAAGQSFEREKSALRRLPGLAIIAHRRGDAPAARQALATLVAEYGDKSNYQYAQVFSQWGDHDKALAALQRAWDQRDGGIMLMYNDPLLAPLRPTPQFRALASSAGFI